MVPAGRVSGRGDFVGILAGLLGVGGGIVLVPCIYYGLGAAGAAPDHAMHIAVGTSLAVIVPTGLASARAHGKKGAVLPEILRLTGPGIVAGTIIGTLAAGYFSGDALKGIFAVALAGLTVVMMFDPARLSRATEIPGRLGSGLAGCAIGALATLMGIGGATVSVPWMTLHGIPIHKAVGTAAALGLLISIPAALGFVLIGLDADGLPPFSLGYVNMAAWTVIAPAAVLTAPWGARAAHALPVKPLRRIFAGFMAVVALRMLYEMLGANF